MTNDKLEELERLLKAGTPGPWRDRADERYSPNAVLYGPDDTDGDFLVIGSLRGSKSAGSHSHSVHSIPSRTQALANAALIVAAINALPELVAMAKELDAARAELAGVREAAVSVLDNYARSFRKMACEEYLVDSLTFGGATDNVKLAYGRTQGIELARDRLAAVLKEQKP